MFDDDDYDPALLNERVPEPMRKPRPPKEQKGRSPNPEDNIGELDAASYDGEAGCPRGMFAQGPNRTELPIEVASERQLGYVPCKNLRDGK